MKAATACAGTDPGAEDPFFHDDGRECLPLGWTAGPESDASRRSGRSDRLYTSVVDLDGGGSRPSLAFCAMVADGTETVRRRLAVRYGGWIVSDAAVVEGVAIDDPLVVELVSPSLMAMLDRVAADPGGAEGDGFDMVVERRFA